MNQVRPPKLKTCPRIRCRTCSRTTWTRPPWRIKILKSGVLGDISLPAHAGPPSAGQKNSRGRISASPADPRRHIAAGIQRAGTLYSVPALVSWSYSFLCIPATVLSIAEAKSEGSRDFVGFLSGISRDKVGASPILPEVPAQHNQKGRGTIRRSPRASGHRIRFAPYSAHPADPFLCC